MIEVVQEFLDELPARLAHLQDAIERRSLSDLCRLAHQLKGAGGSYGYAQLTTLAANLEQQAKGGGDDAALRQSLDQLVDIAARLQTVPST